MFHLSVYEVIEIINAISEILIIALFYHGIFDRKYNSYLPYCYPLTRGSQYSSGGCRPGAPGSRRPLLRI